MKSPLTHFLVALIIGGAALVGYGVWYAVVSAKMTEAESIQNQITAATENVNHMSSARGALTEIAGDESKIQGYFVSDTGVGAFITALESLGLSQKATVSVLSVAAGGVPAHPTLLLSLSIKGTFDAIMRTIGAIEYAPYAISIATVSVGQAATNDWHADLDIAVGSVPSVPATSTP